MIHSVLEEIKYVKKNEAERGVKFPETTYLFVENYGRSMQEEMQDIAEALGKREYFTFRADWLTKQSGVYGDFQLELQKHATLGKEYEGCVLVELSTMVNEPELLQILSRLKQHEEKITSFVTVKDDEDVQEITKMMEQFFFTRVVEGQIYSPEEQYGIIKAELEKYGFNPEEKRCEELLEYLKEFPWKKTDAVESKLRNVVKKLVYEKMLEHNSSLNVTYEEIKNALSGPRKDGATTRIGFLLEG